MEKDPLELFQVRLTPLARYAARVMIAAPDAATAEARLAGVGIRGVEIELAARPANPDQAEPIPDAIVVPPGIPLAAGDLAELVARHWRGRGMAFDSAAFIATAPSRLYPAAMLQ